MGIQQAKKRIKILKENLKHNKKQAEENKRYEPLASERARTQNRIDTMNAQLSTLSHVECILDQEDKE